MRNKHLIVQFNLAHFNHHLAAGALIPLLPLLRQSFGLNYFQSGVLAAAFSLSLGFGQIPMAMLADRFSRRLVIIAGLLGVGAASIGVSLTSTFWQMVTWVVVMGLFASTYHAPASSFISQALPLEQRGRALGQHVIGGSAAFIVVPIAALWLATFFDSWRAAFFVLAWPALLTCPLLWLGTQELVGDVTHRRPSSTNEQTGDAHENDASAGPWLGILRAIGLLAFFVMVMQLVVSSVNSYLPLFVVDQHAVSPRWGGLVTSLIAGAGIIGAPLGGALSDRLGRKRVILVALSLSGPLLLAVTKSSYGLLLLLALCCYGLVMVARMPLAESLIADHVPVRRRATVLSVYLFVGQETGGLVTPLLGGFVDAHGFDAVLTTIGVMLCGIAALAWLLRKHM
jgi:MFS family permease